MGEDRIELHFVGQTKENLSENITYQQATGKLFYQNTHIATLSNQVNLSIDETNFILASRKVIGATWGSDSNR